MGGAILRLETVFEDEFTLKSILLIGRKNLDKVLGTLTKKKKPICYTFATCKLLIPFGYYINLNLLMKMD